MKLLPTVIICSDPQDFVRGYSLLGKEFFLAEPQPRKTEGVTMDGVHLVDDYWVVSKDEYFRVVPEASRTDFDSHEVLIPKWSAQFSFKPGYLR